MTRVLVVSNNSLVRAIAEALNDLAIKVVSAYPEQDTISNFYISHSVNYSYPKRYKSMMHRQAKFNEAGIQQRRKDLTKFHEEKHDRMTRKLATKRRSRFV